MHKGERHTPEFESQAPTERRHKGVACLMGVDI